MEGVDGLRIALSVDLGSWEVEDEVAANTCAAGEALIEAGAKVDEVAIPWNLELLMDTARRHFASIFGADIAGAADAFPDLVNDYVRAWAGRSARADGGAGLVPQGSVSRGGGLGPIGQLFETYDALICPTWAVTGIPAGDSILGQLFDAGGERPAVHVFHVDAVQHPRAVPGAGRAERIAPSNGVLTGSRSSPAPTTM
jgi:Asp-tRNA(Asn)/Glu-tRNA(Gln) amidotransferase A subunit family amidase